MPNGFSVYGGARIVAFEGEVVLFNGSGGGAARYTLMPRPPRELGYMLGAAYERPDIAHARGADLLQRDHHDTCIGDGNDGRPGRREHDLPDVGPAAASAGGADRCRRGHAGLRLGPLDRLDLAFEISPTIYTTFVSNGRPLVDYEKDVFTYVIGGARVLNDQWTVLGSLTYEAEQDVFSGNLGPTDGRTSLGIGARYTMGDMRITGGINYTWIGDAETQAPNPFPLGTQFSSFTDNDAIGVGLRVGYSF
jgi:long-chain fatty acid transport protein